MSTPPTLGEVQIKVDTVTEVLKTNLKTSLATLVTLDKLEGDSLLLLDTSRDFITKTTELKRKKQRRRIQIGCCIVLLSLILILPIVLYASLRK